MTNKFDLLYEQIMKEFQKTPDKDWRFWLIEHDWQKGQESLTKWFTQEERNKMNDELDELVLKDLQDALNSQKPIWLDFNYDFEYNNGHGAKIREKHDHVKNATIKDIFEKDGKTFCRFTYPKELFGGKTEDQEIETDIRRITTKTVLDKMQDIFNDIEKKKEDIRTGTGLEEQLKSLQDKDKIAKFLLDINYFDKQTRFQEGGFLTALKKENEDEFTYKVKAVADDFKNNELLKKFKVNTEDPQFKECEEAANNGKDDKSLLLKVEVKVAPGEKLDINRLSFGELSSEFFERTPDDIGAWYKREEKASRRRD